MDNKALDLAALTNCAKTLVGKDWHWWTSNSYRRLTFKDGRNTRDGGALSAFKNQFDGWPDVAMAAGVQEFVELASPKAVLAMAARIEEREAALRPFAKDAKMWSMVADDHRPKFHQIAAKPDPARFTVGDLRRATAALGEGADDA